MHEAIYIMTFSLDGGHIKSSIFSNFGTIPAPSQLS
jgi:hypothetical protein